jgi:hypothetical protein
MRAGSVSVAGDAGDAGSFGVVSGDEADAVADTDAVAAAAAVAVALREDARESGLRCAAGCGAGMKT